MKIRMEMKIVRGTLIMRIQRQKKMMRMMKIM